MTHKLPDITCTCHGNMRHKLQDLVFPDGNRMPIIGLGTWQAVKLDVGAAVDAALQAGYRHIDTAYLQNNEDEIGDAINRWLRAGRLRREDIFIVAKLPPAGNRAESVEYYLKKSLKSLQLDYVDLYLIHSPIGAFEVNGDAFGFVQDGSVALDMNTDLIKLWKAMEAQVDAGRTRSIGLSSFNSQQIKRIWKSARIKPANLQVELHVYFQQRELAAFCNALDITVCAFVPVGSQRLYQIMLNRGEDTSKVPRQNPLTDPLVNVIAAKHRKTPAQILLRHTMQRGIAVIPHVCKLEHVRENFNVFDFELPAEDISLLDSLDRRVKGREFNDAIAPNIVLHPEYPLNIPY